MELIKDRGIPTGLVVLLVSRACDDHQPAAGQTRELAVDGSHPPSSQPDEVGALEPAFRLAKEETQHPLLDGCEESIGEPCP